MTYLAEAVTELRPNCKFMIKEDELIWLDNISLKPTDEEIKSKIQELKVKDKKKEIEDIETQKIKMVLKEYGYDDRGDVAMYAQLKDSPFYNEATEIQKWIEAMDLKMYELQDKITPENVGEIDIEELVKEYPEFKSVLND